MFTTLEVYTLPGRFNKIIIITFSINIEIDLWPYRGHNYFFESTPLTWLDANNRCLARGGYLVTFNDADEWNYIKNQAVDT